MKNPIILISAFITLTLSSCYYDNVETLYPNLTPCVVDSTLTYQKTIVPVLQNYCYSCHSDATKANGGNIRLDTYDDVANNIDDIIKDIEQIPGNGYNAMPKGSSKIDDCSINQIKKWLELGGPLK